MILIKSFQNPLVKHFVKLVQSKSYREEKKSSVLFGCKLIKEISQKVKIKKYLHIETPLSADIPSVTITPEIAQKISCMPAPQDGIAEVDLPNFQDLSTFNTILILDNIQDPGNLGTIIRTAQGLGIEGVHLYGDCADPFSPKSISASRGAVFTLPLGYGSVDSLKEGRHWIAADMEGEEISDCSFNTPFALIFGNEGSGISEELMKLSKRVAISLDQQIESLNVAAAAAIFCYLSLRSR